LSSICRATKRNGEPCTLSATDSNGYCWAHSPAHAAERKQNAAKGGKGRIGGKLKELEDKLEALYDAIEGGTMDRGTGAVLNQVLNTHVRLIEARHKLSELEELERQVAAIVEADKRASSMGHRRY
jgi:hypothetical protein